MRIAIDISQVVYGTGVSRYREHLARLLPRIDKENEYLFFAGAWRKKREIQARFPQALVFPLPPRAADILWNKLHLFPLERFIGQVDIIHTSDWAEPPARAVKVTTVHDLIPFKFAKLTPRPILSAHQDRLRWVLQESRRIIVPSENTKRDLVALGVGGEIIRVIYEAPNFHQATAVEIARVKKVYGIHDDYLIAIGTKPWKNLERIISAFHLAKGGKRLKLLVAGEKGGSRLENEGGVRFLGYVPDSDLSALLTGAKTLVFASLYEGFGVPILDAFNCGVPVVTSHVSSMPEVAGDAAVFVDPYSVNSIAEGIEKALSAPKTYIAKGLRRVKNFSWEKCARETLTVYQELT